MVCFEAVAPISWWVGLAPTEQAAWAQAVGTILAVLAAIGVGVHQARTARALVGDERRRQAAITATGLALAFEAVRGEADFKLTILRSILERIPDDDGPHGEVHTEEIRAFLHLESANALAAADQQVLLFDEHIGKVVIMAARSAQAFNRNLKTALAAPRPVWNKRDMRELHVRMVESLANAVEGADRAITVMKSTHKI